MFISVFSNFVDFSDGKRKQFKAQIMENKKVTRTLLTRKRMG